MESYRDGNKKERESMIVLEVLLEHIEKESQTLFPTTWKYNAYRSEPHNLRDHEKMTTTLPDPSGFYN